MANPTDANPLGRGRGWMAAVVSALLALLYLVPAATTGLWEPWETAPATLARGLSDGTAGSIFAPMKSGALFSRPWLSSLMGQVGFSAGGGSELGLRLPALLLVVAAAAAGFMLLDRWVGRRAACRRSERARRVASVASGSAWAWPFSPRCWYPRVYNSREAGRPARSRSGWR